MSSKEYEQRLSAIIAERPPDLSCDRCNGRGWVSFDPDPGALLIWLKLGKKPCICCYIKNSKMRQIVEEVKRNA